MPGTAKGQFLLFYAIFSFLLSTLHAQSSRDYFAKGLHYAKQNEYKSAIAAFESAIASDRNFANAYHQLALSYLQLGTIFGRRKATFALEKALSLEGNNILFNLDMAKLSHLKKMDGEAKSRLEKVLRLTPTHAEAHYLLGRLYMENMLWYKDMVNPQEDVIFTFEKYANEDMALARDHFEKAISYNPEFVLPYYQLAFLFYEYGDYIAMKSLLHKAISFHSKDSDLYLLLGLVYHTERKFQVAHNYFLKAMQFMSKEELHQMQSLYPVLTPNDQLKYSTLDSPQQKQLSENYWQKRDPLLLTDINERLLEHYSRLTYVKLRFGNQEEGINGRATDQGTMYIRFGAPQKTTRTRGSMGTDAGSGAEMTDNRYFTPARERWQYADFTIAFEDEYMGKNFNFMRTFNPENDGKIIFEQKIKSEPNTYELFEENSQMQIPYSMTQFKADSGKTRFELFYGMPAKKLTFYRNDSEIITKLQRGLFLFDKTKNLITQKKEIRRNTLLSIQDPQGEYLKLDRIQSTVIPGNCTIKLEVLDEFTQNYGGLEFPVHIRKFDNDSLTLSDILVANQIEQKASALYGIHDLEIVPNLYHVFHPQDMIYYYFEIYNPKTKGKQEANYQVETTVRCLEYQQNPVLNFVSSLGDIIGISNEKPGEISTIQRYSSGASVERNYSALQLADAKPGKYQLTIRVTDTIRSSNSERKVEFVIQ
ncbi:MAG: tetratricopeptide repeat protein [Deferribacteres bacterium]|nr:tetratricopeptide repeat protein [candidate division KSB1 bacterium]MCB9504003.1 tetratricopeptide repeat protein [Deferribacteres bacterium]